MGVSAGCLLALSAATRTLAQEKAYYIDCCSDGVVVYPGKLKLQWDALEKQDNALTKLLNEVSVDKANRYVVVMVRPGSGRTFRFVQRLVKGSGVDFAVEPVDEARQFQWDAQWHALLLKLHGSTNHNLDLNERFFKPPFRVVATKGREALYFECRGKEIFWVDQAELRTQVKGMICKISPEIRSNLTLYLKTISKKTISDEFYTVNMSYVLPDVLALDPRSDVRGEDAKTIALFNSRFASKLSQPNKNKPYVFFLVRENGFEIFRAARMVAERMGCDTIWEVLPCDFPLKFHLNTGEVLY